MDSNKSDNHSIPPENFLQRSRRQLIKDLRAAGFTVNSLTPAIESDDSAAPSSQLENPSAKMAQELDEELIAYGDTVTDLTPKANSFHTAPLVATFIPAPRKAD